MVYQPAGTQVGDPISLSDPKAGALMLSTSLQNYEPVSTDAVNMFARRDAFRTVAESIASAMAGVPIDLYKRDPANGRTKIGEGSHPVANALDEPNPGMTQYRLIEACNLDMVLHDRYAVMMLDTDTGLQLVRLPGRWISFAVDGFRRITDVVLRAPGTSGRKVYIPIERVIFDVGYDPSPAGEETSGYPISRTLAASATELERGAAYRAALLAGGPKVPMYVARPKDAPKWTKDGREFFDQTFQSYSAERAGQVPLLEDGMELKAAPQLIADSVQYKETRLAAQIEFAISMHFPPELVGYRTGNFSNIAALREQLYVDTLGSKFSAQRQAWNAGLRRGGYLKRGEEYIEENVAIRLMGNPELQAAILQTQVGAPVRTVNEARRILNLPPIEGGDELIVPLNVIKGGLASPRDTGPKALDPSRRAGMRPLQLESKAAVPQAYLTRIEKQAARFATDLRKQYKAQAERVQRALGDGDSPGSLEDAFDMEGDTTALAAVILPHSYAIAQSGAGRVLDQYNPDEDGFSAEVMLPWLDKAATATAGLIVAGLFAEIATRVVGPDWLESVKGYLDDVVLSGPDLWAETVATTSSSFGAHDAAKASGLGQKTWVHTGGGNSSRPEHEAIDGETVGIDELFSNGLRYPGDPTGSAEDNAQCHCRIEYSRAPQ